MTRNQREALEMIAVVILSAVSSLFAGAVLAWVLLQLVAG